MNTPPGLLAVACALWAAQSGQWLVAAAAAFALEAPRVVAVRWNVEQGHFNRLSDFCSVLIVLAGAFLFFNYGNPRGLLLLFQWLPLLLLPLALAQAWGNLDAVEASAFVWTLRKTPPAVRQALNLAYPYLAVWIFAAAAASATGWTFYAGLTGLAAWSLWTVRPRRYPFALWLGLLVTAAGAGYGMQAGLYRAQEWIGDFVAASLEGSGARTDPYRARTDLGHIGELKHDDAIVLRVRADATLTPLLLHRASYNGYFDRSWSARNAPLAVLPRAGGSRWALAAGAPSGTGVTVHEYSARANPVLSLPRGTAEVHGLDASAVKRNALGTVQAEREPGYFSYVAALDAGAAPAAAPTAEDLRLPVGDERLFSDLAAKLELAALAPQDRVAAVRRHFADGFGYTTYQKAAAGARSPLADFLLRTRAGHCEYFATATVLLLRAAGVPARYATGFSVQEYSRLEEAYIVRVRHAHAWAAAWVGGRWVDVDTTPATWARVEAEDASWWAPLTDLASWLRFRGAQLTAGASGESRTAALAVAIALLLALWFGWRLYAQRRLMVFGRRAAGAAHAPPGQGLDSELFLIDRELARAGLARGAGETVMAWLARIEEKLPPGAPASELRELARLHYRYRFDPAGLPPAERARLRERSLAWLKAAPGPGT
jgi:hypothetical protein